MKISRIVYTALFTLLACSMYALPGYAQVTETYCSTDVPVEIFDLTTVTSDLNVPVAGEIADVIVKLQIDHTWRADLDVTLTSPELTTLDLFSDIDASNNNFGNECLPMPNFILDDSAALPVTDFTSANGFGDGNPVGTFRPEEPLSTFIGQEQGGQWTLSIFDDVPSDQGFLNCWCLEITRAQNLVRPIPTISQWGMIAFAGILGVSGVIFLMLRRRREAV